MTGYTGFTGFPQKGLDFLVELAQNNDRAWFKARKTIYETQVQRPAQRFVEALGPRLHEISPRLAFDSRLVGGSLMKIHRDTRFSKDKTPYETKVRLMFWEGPSRKEMLSGFYVRIEPSGAGVFAGIWEFDRVRLAAYRDAVEDDLLGGELEEAIGAVRGAGNYTVGGEHYKRVPQGYDRAHPRAQLLRYNGLWAHTEDIDPAVLTDPELMDVCFEHCLAMAPIHSWLVRLETAQ